MLVQVSARGFVDGFKIDIGPKSQGAAWNEEDRVWKRRNMNRLSNSPQPTVRTYRGLDIVYEVLKRGWSREHTIDILGMGVGFEAQTEEEVFQKMDHWINNQNNGGCNEQRS